MLLRGELRIFASLWPRYQSASMFCYGNAPALGTKLLLLWWYLSVVWSLRRVSWACLTLASLEPPFLVFIGAVMPCVPQSLAALDAKIVDLKKHFDAAVNYMEQRASAIEVKLDLLAEWHRVFQARYEVAESKTPSSDMGCQDADGSVDGCSRQLFENYEVLVDAPQHDSATSLLEVKDDEAVISQTCAVRDQAVALLSTAVPAILKSSSSLGVASASEYGADSVITSSMQAKFSRPQEALRRASSVDPCVASAAPHARALKTSNGPHATIEAPGWTTPGGGGSRKRCRLNSGMSTREEFAVTTEAFHASCAPPVLCRHYLERIKPRKMDFKINCDECFSDISNLWQAWRCDECDHASCDSCFRATQCESLLLSAAGACHWGVAFAGRCHMIANQRSVLSDFPHVSTLVFSSYWYSHWSMATCLPFCHFLATLLDQAAG